MQKLTFLSAFLFSLLSSNANAHLYDALQTQLQNHKYGMVDARGETIIPFEYDKIGGMQGNLIVVKKEGKWGVIDVKGKQIMPFKFINPPSFLPNNAVGWVKIEDKFGLISVSGELMTSELFDEKPRISEGFISAKFANKWGVLNQLGQWVVPPEYDDVSAFSEGLARVRLNDKYGFIDYQGNKVIDVVFQSASHFKNGMVYVEQADERFPLDRQGKRIQCDISPFFKFETCLESGFSVFSLPNYVDDDIYYGVLNPQGKIALQPIYQHINLDFKEGLARIFDRNELFGYVNSNFEVVIEPQYSIASSFENGLATVFSPTLLKYGVINTKNEAVIPFNYRFIHQFKKHLAVAAVLEDNLKYGVIDDKNTIIIPFIYQNAGEFVLNNTLSVQKDELWGLINLKNQVIIPFEYEALRNSVSDYFAAKKSGKWGFIDKQNRNVIPFEYDDARSFSEGLAAVKRGEKWGFINPNNEVVLPFEFDTVVWDGFSDGKVYVIKGNVKGTIDKQGQFLNDSEAIIEPRK